MQAVAWLAPQHGFGGDDSVFSWSHGFEHPIEKSTTIAASPGLRALMKLHVQMLGGGTAGPCARFTYRG